MNACKSRSGQQDVWNTQSKHWWNAQPTRRAAKHHHGSNNNRKKSPTVTQSFLFSHVAAIDYTVLQASMPPSGGAEQLAVHAQFVFVYLTGAKYVRLKQS